MIKKCSMCGQAKEESEYRFMNKQKRYNAYCKACEKLYNKEYKRIIRAREKDRKEK